MEHPEIFVTSEVQVNLFKGCLESFVFVIPTESAHIINQVNKKIMLLVYATVYDLCFLY